MRVSIPLTGDLAIIQGETYQALTLTFPGDLTTWTPRGQIRTGLLEDSGTLLAEFAFGTPLYDADADTTNIYPTLTAFQTANLPKTKWQGTGEYSRSAVYYYDVELENESVVIKSKTAIVQVIGEVTGSGTPAPSALETFLIASNNLSEITDPEEAQNNLFPDGIPGGLPPDLSDYATITALNEGLETKQPIGDYLESDDIANFETTTQLNDRDTANRSRSNHTGTQTASTISDFDTEVSNNTDVAANTSARHDAVTAVDSSEIDFTLTGQQITASIVAGSIDESKLDASVNALLDLADSSVQLTGDQSIAGTKTFTTALILPNNSRINGVEHFYQTTKPTTRGDASALGIGDRWWKTDDGTEWFWNGTYWLSNTKGIISRGRAVSSNSNNTFPLYNLDSDIRDVPLKKPIFLDRVSYSIALDSLGDENNYRQFSFAHRFFSGSAPTIYTSENKLYGTLARIFVVDESVNLFYNPLIQGDVLGFTFNIGGVGVSPPNGTNPSATLYFREVFL